MSGSRLSTTPTAAAARVLDVPSRSTTVNLGASAGAGSVAEAAEPVADADEGQDDLVGRSVPADSHDAVARRWRHPDRQSGDGGEAEHLDRRADLDQHVEAERDPQGDESGAAEPEADADEQLGQHRRRPDDVERPSLDEQVAGPLRQRCELVLVAHDPIPEHEPAEPVGIDAACSIPEAR